MMIFNDISQSSKSTSWQLLAEFSLPISEHVEVEAIQRLSTTVNELQLSIHYWKRLQVAVSTAVASIREKYLGSRNIIKLTIRVQACTRAPDDTDSLRPPKQQDSSLGWGFFLVERIETATQFAQLIPTQVIEVFIYPE